MAATTGFLDVNGEPPDLGEDEAFQLVLSVAEDESVFWPKPTASSLEDCLRDRTNQREVPECVCIEAAHQSLTTSHVAGPTDAPQDPQMSLKPLVTAV